MTTLPRTSLGTAAARKLATTTKSLPQMQGITPRWLLRMLPWVHVAGGVYRVNRRLSYAVGDGRVGCVSTGMQVEVIPETLRELPILHGFDDTDVLGALARRFVQRELRAGDLLVDAGRPADQIFLIAHGKVNKVSLGKYGDDCVLSVLADGDHLGDDAIAEGQEFWEFSARAVTPCIVLALPRAAFDRLIAESSSLRAHVESYRERRQRPQDKQGQAAIAMAAGHAGEPVLPGTFVDYDRAPREYELGVTQTILRLHTRVADLYNGPMNQMEQQLRLTIETMRERQEHELVNHAEFGLLHNADLTQRLHTRSGPPTPDDMDELLSRRRKTRCFLAHPRTIAAFGRECNSRGIVPSCVETHGETTQAWRGVPLLPCDKIPISASGTSAILAMRVGEEDQGVIGLHQAGIPDEYRPGLSVRFMDIDDTAVVSYLVTAYASVAVLIPDALGILENVEIGR